MSVLTTRHRRVIYDTLSPIVGDEETEALLAQLPSSPGEQPVTTNALDSG